MERHEFYRKLERLLKLPADSVQGPHLLQELEGWDSLAILEFMVLADDDYTASLQPDQITACRTVDDLANLTLQGRAVP